jgi:hypothetical protein
MTHQNEEPKGYRPRLDNLNTSHRNQQVADCKGFEPDQLASIPDNRGDISSSPDAASPVKDQFAIIREILADGSVRVILPWCHESILIAALTHDYKKEDDHSRLTGISAKSLKH